MMFETTIKNWTDTNGDMQGWNSTHRFLTESIEQLRPTSIVEVGVWKGASIIHMAKECKRLGLDTKLYAIDTWLGCDILRTCHEWVPSLRMEHNRPNVWQTFYSNCVNEGVADMIVPLHMDSRSGLRYIKRIGFKVDLYHQDGTHQQGDVYQDLELGYAILRKGGHIIVDDYIKDDKRYPHPCDFSGVVADVDAFPGDFNMKLEIDSPKARLS